MLLGCLHTCAYCFTLVSANQAQEMIVQGHELRSHVQMTTTPCSTTKTWRSKPHLWRPGAGFRFRLRQRRYVGSLIKELIGKSYRQFVRRQQPQQQQQQQSLFAHGGVMQLPWKRASYDREGDANAFWHSGTSGSLVKCHVDCIWHHHPSILSLTVMLGDQCSGVHRCCYSRCG